MKWDRDAHRVCHRLDIGLEVRPPNLDDIAAIPHLREWGRVVSETRTNAISLHFRAHNHILAVARRWTAALFYFEATDIDRDNSFRGMLHCRLGSAMRDNLRHLLSQSPTFRVRQSIRVDRWSSCDFKPHFDELTFSGRIAFPFKSERRVREMTLPKWSGSWERVSGFSGLRRWYGNEGLGCMTIAQMSNSCGILSLTRRIW